MRERRLIESPLPGEPPRRPVEPGRFPPKMAGLVTSADARAVLGRRLVAAESLAATFRCG